MTDYTKLLPEYPLQNDLWCELKKENRPILVYGMGNGADKLFERLNRIGVAVADIFASDGFVRGHYYRGMRVKSFSEVREEYPEFVILLSFASNRQEVLDMLAEIDRSYDMYIPDMPVAGEEYFDKDFYNDNYTEIKAALEALSDDASKQLFASIIKFKLFGKMRMLEESYDTKDNLYSSLPSEDIRVMIDAGAYNGDTVREAQSYFPNLETVYAIEPDPKTFKRLCKYAEGQDALDVRTINAAVLDKCGEGDFISGGNRNSSVNSTASYKHKSSVVPFVTVDSLSVKADYVKYDVEGAELEALVGSEQTIISQRPSLLVSLYHRSRDIFFLTNYLKRKYPFYRLTLKRLRCVPAWEIDLILTT